MACGSGSAHAAESFDGFDAQVIGTFGQDFSLGKAQEFGSGVGVAAHADFIEREREDHGVNELKRIGEQLAALGRAGNRKLADNGIMEAAMTLAQAHGQNVLDGQGIETSEQADDGGSLRGRLGFEGFFEKTDARGADRSSQLDDVFAFGAASRAGQTHGEMLGGGLRDAHEHADQAFGHGFGGERFLDEFGDAVFDADARPQALHPTGAGLLEFRERIKGLLHGAIVPARSGFLAEADERSA